MWQTEDYFFNEKFYLNTLNPKETRKHNGSTYFIFEVDFLLIKLREIPAVCERTCLFLSEAVYLPDHRWLDGYQQYYFVQVDALCNYH